MNSFNGDLYFAAGIDDSKFNVTTAAMERRVEEMSATVQSEAADMETSIQQFAQKGAEYITTFLVGKGMVDLTKSIIEVRGQFQQLEIAFETMLGSTEKANDLMAQLTQTAAKTPFDLQGVAQGAKQLLAYGTAAEEVNDVLVHLGDIASGLSIPLNDIVMLYGTTMTQGRMYTQDLKQFMGRGIPLAEELAKQFGVTKDKVGELVTQGKVTSKEFNAAIMAMSSEGGKFYNLMEKQSASLTGQISNLEDAWDMARNNIGKSMEGIAGDAIQFATSVVENLEPIMHTVRAVAIAYGSYRAALILNSLATKGETGVALIDNTVKKAKIQLLRLEEKATSGAAERIRELKKARQEEIATLENQLSAEERLNLIHQTRIANIGKVLTETQKLELHNLGLTESSEDYERIALSMMSNEQRMAVERGELTKNTGDYIAKLHEAVDAKHINIKAIDDEIAKTQDELKFAVEYRNVVQEQVATSRDRCKSLENEISMLDLAGDSEGAAAKATEWKTEKTKLATLEEELNTAATSVNEKQTNLETLAKKRNAAATVQGTVADKANTATKNLLTIAAKKATLAIKALWAAMKANPLGWILTAVGAVVAIFDRLKTKSEEAKKAQEEEAKHMAELGEESHRAKIKLDDLTEQISTLIDKLDKAKKGTDEYNEAKNDEKLLIGKINEEYGDIFGNYNTLNQWYDVLSQKAAIYVDILYKQALAQDYVNKAVAYHNMIEEKKKEDPSMSAWDAFWNFGEAVDRGIARLGQNLWYGFGKYGNISDYLAAAGRGFEIGWSTVYHDMPLEEMNRELDEFEANEQAALNSARRLQEEIAELAKEYNITIDPHDNGGRRFEDLTDKEKKEIEKRLKLLKDAHDKEEQMRIESQRATIEAKRDGYDKRMAMLKFEHDRELDKIKKDAEELRAAKEKANLGELTQEEKDNIESRIDAANKKYSNARIDAAVEEINLMREKYREYEKWVEMVGQEAADAHFRGLREEGETFSAWVERQIARLNSEKMKNPGTFAEFGGIETMDAFIDAQSGADELAYYENLRRAMEGSVSMATNLTAKIVALKEAIDKIKNDPKLTDEQRATLGLQFAEDLVNAEAENQRRFNETYQMYSKTRRETVAQYQADLDALVKSGNGFQAAQVQAEMKRAMGDLDENFLKSMFAEVFSGNTTRKAIKDAIKQLNNMKGMTREQFNAIYSQDFNQAEFDNLTNNIDRVIASLDALSIRNIGDAFKAIRDGKLAGDLNLVAQGVEYLQSAFNTFANVVSNLSSALNDFADASDNENLKDTAKTVSKVSNVLQSAGSWAGTGASIAGGWGALAGGVLGTVLGIIQEVFNSEAEEREARKQELAELNDNVSMMNDTLSSIYDAVTGLSDAVTGLQYDSLKETLVDTIKTLSQSTTSLYTRHDFGSDGNMSFSDYIRQLFQNMAGISNGNYATYNYRGNSPESFARGAVRRLTELGFDTSQLSQNINQMLQWYADEYFRSLQDEAQTGTWYYGGLSQYLGMIINEFVNFINNQAREIYNHKQALVDKMQELYESGSYDTTDYFNLIQSMYDLEIKEAELALAMAEFRGDADAIAEATANLEKIRLKMAESLVDFVENLTGTGMAGMISEWADIFEEFGNDSEAALDKIGEGIDRMVYKLIRQKAFIEPMLASIDQYYKQFVADHSEQLHDAEGKIKWTTDLLADLVSGMYGLAGDAAGLWEEVQRLLEERGISLSEIIGDSSTLTGSIQNVSEETGGIIAGRLNAVVINQAEGVSVMRQQLLVQYEMRNSLAAIQSDVSTIKQRIGNTATPNPYLYRGIL